MYRTSSPNPDILRLNPVSMPEIAVPIKVTAMTPIATPNVVSIDLVRFAATCRAAMRKPSIHSARFFIALDASIPQSHNSPSVPRDIFFVSHDDDRVAALIKILQQHHDLFASPRVEIPGRFVRQNDRRIIYQSSGNRHSLALAAGALIWLVVHPVAQADRFHCPFGSASSVI